MRTAIIGFITCICCCLYASPVRSNLGGALHSAIETAGEVYPENVVPVEYIEAGNMTNCIVTPLRFCDLPTATFEIVLSLNPNVARTSGSFVGCIASSIDGYFGISCYEAIALYLGGKGKNYIGYSDHQIWSTPIAILIDYVRNMVYVNGHEVSISPKDNFESIRASTQRLTTLVLIGRTHNSSPCRIGVRYHSCKCSLSGVPLFDMVPVRFIKELGEWEGGMYDKVSGEIYKNSGAGEFLIGPDKRR